MTAHAVLTERSGPPWQLDLDRPDDGTLRVRLSGSWRMQDGLPPASRVQDAFGGPPAVRRLTFDAARVSTWDTGLLTFVRGALARCDEAGIEADRSGLPSGVQRLLALASAVPVDSRSLRRAPGA